MKFVSKAIALSAFAALAACGGGGDDAAENIEASADNQADMLEMEAENLMDQADNATGAAEMTLENQADALENQADAVEDAGENRSEEHTSELQTLMRISNAVFCFTNNNEHNT